jgi:hypothetical protein
MPAVSAGVSSGLRIVDRRINDREAALDRLPVVAFEP